MTVINELDLDTLTLRKGAHDEASAEMCVMEAAAFIAGEDWSDHPQCASPVIGAFLRNWNDVLDDDARQTLKPYAREVIGTRKTPKVDAELAWMATDWPVRFHAPAWLRLAGLTEQADLLAGMSPLDPETCPAIMPALKAVRSDAAAARAAAGDAARAAAGAAARAALAPTVSELQESAHNLVRRMIAHAKAA